MTRERTRPATPAPFRIGKRVFDWGERTYVMGIVNATPDSFSGDGLLASGSDGVVDRAVAQGRAMVARARPRSVATHSQSRSRSSPSPAASWTPRESANRVRSARSDA